MKRFAMLLSLSCLIGCDAGSSGASDLDAGSPLPDGEARSADGVPIRYEVHGEGDPTIVLVHGWANTRRVWGVHPTTLSRDNQVVALDLAGHGLSGADRQEWTVDAFGEDVVSVVEQLGLEDVVLVGFSMGGAVVLEAADRLGDRVRGIVLVDTFKDPDAEPSEAEFEGFAAAMRANWGDPDFIRAFGFKADAPDSLIDYVIGTMPPEPHEYWFTALRSLFDWVSADLASTLQSIDRPMAAINTAEPPTNVEALRRYVPSFTVDTLAGVGHGGILLRRVEDFDARLLAIVERFEAAGASAP